MDLGNYDYRYHKVLRKVSEEDIKEIKELAKNRIGNIDTKVSNETLFKTAFYVLELNQRVGVLKQQVTKELRKRKLISID